MSLAGGAVYLTYGSGVQIAGFYIFPTRLLVYTCYFRVLLKKEFGIHQIVYTDKAILLLYTFTSLVLLLRQDGSPQLAVAKGLDGILSYFVCRALIQSSEDLKWFSKIFIIVLIPFVGCLAIERLTQKNLFTYVGATSETWIREGKVRCYGSFRHPSLLGSLGACFFPMFVGLSTEPHLRKRMILGCLVSLAIVFASNSGGPVSVLTIAFIGWLFWPLRRRMQTVRRLLSGSLLLLALSMNAPIWYLLARVSSITGGTGWHRSYLMDVAFKNISQWGLIGTRLENIEGWFPYILPATGSADITNQFIGFGIQGGILAMLFFLYFIYTSFSYLGKALKVARTSENNIQEKILWGLGVSLTAHVSNWFGITYFDQFHLLWLIQMGALVSLSQHTLSTEYETPATEAGFDADYLPPESPKSGQRTVDLPDLRTA